MEGGQLLLTGQWSQCVPKCFNGREAQPTDRGMAPELFVYEGLRGQSPTSVIPRLLESMDGNQAYK